MRSFYHICLALIILLGVACNPLPKPYKIDVQQGNIVEVDKVNELKPGMTKNQVKYIMGTPMLEDFFNSDRWDYLYYFKSGNGVKEQKRVTLFFQGDKLIKISGER